MEITLKNLGLISEAQFTVGDLTVICGKNNTGKTYITYATYGFLDYWQKLDFGRWAIEDLYNFHQEKIVHTLIDQGSVEVTISDLISCARLVLQESVQNYSLNVSKVFNADKENFKNAMFNMDSHLEAIMENRKISHFYVRSVDKDDLINIVFLPDETIGKVIFKLKHDGVPVIKLIPHIIKTFEKVVYRNVIPKAFMASSERTGAALFQREVDFTRSRLIDLLKETNINPQQLLGRFTAEYPLPVKHNIDFIRDLPNIVRKQSEFSQQYPEILQAFADIAGGGYDINHVGGITYSPTSQPDLKLSLAESSSTVRSLVDIGFYLRHLAQKGDLLMIDEPELNLHPENQRKIARLFAMLVNAGLRVFITTHSDYIIKEFNTLLLLNKPDERLRTLAHREGYQATELLKPEQLNVYMTAPDKNVIDKACYTLVPAKVTADSGIELTSFDETIEDINRIQDEIVWG